MKTQSSYPFLLFLFLTAALVSCDKDDNELVDPNSPKITSVSPASGYMGDRVIITGTNFSTDPATIQIRFGDVLAKLDSASSTRLFTRVPKDAERCQIEVSVGNLRGFSQQYFMVHQILPVFGSMGEEANQLDNLTPQFVRIISSLEKAGSQNVVQHGHVWSEERMPYLIEDGKITPNSSSLHGHSALGGIYWNDSGPYHFTSYVKDLMPGTTYHVRSYIATRQGIYYGPLSQFTTPGNKNL
jgi:hypothetical protein